MVRPWQSSLTSLTTGSTPKQGKLARISYSEGEESHPQASSSKSKIINGLSYLQGPRKGDSLSVRLADDKNPLADFKFDQLPTELLVKIFHHARPDTIHDAYNEKYHYPVPLSHVCRHWRSVALDAPPLWASVRILEYHTEETREAARIYLERSKTCPIFLTWFTEPDHFHTDVPGVIENLIIPGVERWQRITLIAGSKTVPDALLAAIAPLDFPILQDIEISCVPFAEPFSPKPALCHNAPLLRRCRFRDIPSLPPFPSNLAVLDCVFLAFGSKEFDLNPLLEFLPHVAHSLEHLRFGPPPTSEVRFTPRTSKIVLENLKSLLITDSHVIMDHILAPNLTYFVAFHPPVSNAREAAQMFGGFSAPKLQAIQFHKTPLLPFLTTHNLPSMFPQLQSVLLSGCEDESAFASLLEPPQLEKPPSLQDPSGYPPKHREVENPFPHLKKLTISDMSAWTSFQAAIEKRFKNGDSSLRKIQLPREDAPEAIMRHLRRWIPAQGIELVLYKSRDLPRSTPEFQDEFCDEENRLFFEISIEERELSDDYDDDGEDYDYGWEGGAMSHGSYDDFDDDGLDYDGLDDDDGDEDEEGDFYEV